jgi:hypothetical protein
MSDDNTQDKAEPSPASAGSHNANMATARLSAANTWLQEEIERLRLTGMERAAIGWAIMECESMPTTRSREAADTLRALLKRLG